MIRRASWTGLPFALTLLAGMWPASTQAQIEVGWWWFGGYQTPSSVTLINDLAAQRTPGAIMSQPQALRAPSRTGRDTTFFERYDVETRRALEARVARRTPGRPDQAPAQPAPAQPATPRRAVAPLSSFFDASGTMLVWPKDAPAEAALGTKRDAAEVACVAVAKEVAENGVARVSTVTKAREALVEYGNAALAYLHERSSDRVVQLFHDFLLSLYDSLGAAAFPKS